MSIGSSFLHDLHSWCIVLVHVFALRSDNRSLAPYFGFGTKAPATVYAARFMITAEPFGLDGNMTAFAGALLVAQIEQTGGSSGAITTASRRFNVE
jgi:hypothetical protein